MDPVVFVLVLGAALLHASWNAFVKAGGDPLVRLALITAVMAACGLPLVLAYGLPPRASWPSLATSVVIHQVYFAFLVLGYRAGDLSVVYPIARGAAPLLVAGGAWLLAGESLDATGWIAIAIVSAGIASLSLARGGGRQGSKAVVFGLLTAVTIAAYSVADGFGGRAAGSDRIVSYVALLGLLQAIPIVAYVAITRGAEARAVLRSGWRSTLVGGVFAFGAYGLVIWAMSQTAMSYVSALREVSVLVAALIGTRLLGEPFGNRRMAASAAVAAGIILLQWSRVG